MNLNVTSDAEAIATAIDTFNPVYHRDYFSVRAAASDYLSNNPSIASVNLLACSLIEALEGWGAGKRSAPTCRREPAVCQLLSDVSLRGKLKRLAASLDGMSLDDGERSIKTGGVFQNVEDFDICLIDTLNELADGLLVGNTNVTYPMKALLLITGLMPAFDSQVRAGLHVAGFSGFAWRGRVRTQYLMPAHNRADAKRVCALPFYIADCLSRSRQLLEDAIAISKFPALKDQVGRLFDILFFMQGSVVSSKPLVSFSARHKKLWYAI
ncbi:hypothetical protein MKD50_00950 [Cupriavidus sp. WGtm5]|uniref:hypothetical protein n=1 Tax=Cupriavidus sp. WGtm5 TaxID=2919926 RepID=UPI002091691E|nr:hypothetical protein [Cupriavidus sp. WGtm5]MCO4887926.1 hypothetical protein [Cupriavidus sp. WGtm5]